MKQFIEGEREQGNVSVDLLQVDSLIFLNLWQDFIPEVISFCNCTIKPNKPSELRSAEGIPESEEIPKLCEGLCESLGNVQKN